MKDKKYVAVEFSSGPLPIRSGQQVCISTSRAPRGFLVGFSLEEDTDRDFRIDLIQCGGTTWGAGGDGLQLSKFSAKFFVRHNGEELAIYVRNVSGESRPFIAWGRILVVEGRS